MYASRQTRSVFVLTLLATVLLATAGAARAQTSTLTPVAFGDSWSHLGVARGGTPGFEAVGFVDSSWSVGNAPFGALTSCPSGPNLPVPTGTGGWPLSGDLLLRKTFTVPEGTGPGSITVRIDNDVAVYLNGTLMGSAVRENCADVSPPAPFAFSTGTLAAGQNVLAIRAADRGGQRYVDAKLEVEFLDTDDDGIGDPDDNCPERTNAGQEDADDDGKGDVCDGYEVAIAPDDLSAGERETLTATITSRSAGDDLQTAGLTAPAGVKVLSASQGGVAGNTVSLESLDLADGTTTQVEITVDASCAASSGTWATEAQASGGNGLTLLSPVEALDVTGTCSLAYATEPQDARVDQFIRGGADFDPAGPPFAVEVRAANGEASPGTVVPITLAIGPTSSGFGTLNGTTTVITTAGRAEFSNVKIDDAGAYRLTAGSAGITGGTSASLRIVDVAVSCPPSGCSGQLAGAQTKLTVQATSTGGGGSGFLTLALNDGLQLDCVGYTELVPDTVTFDATSASLAKTLTYEISKAALQNVPNNGAAHLDVCFGAPFVFPVKPGTVRTQVLFDGDADGTGETWYVGRLPDCPKAGAITNACISKRQKTGSGVGIVTIEAPPRPEDPRMR